MHVEPQAKSRHPGWDGRLMRFQVVIDETSVGCSISKTALSDIASCYPQQYLDPISCFQRYRGWLEGIARAKYAMRTSLLPGRLYIWSEDVVDPPLAGVRAGAARGGKRLIRRM
jgi:hypothetical protein